MWEAMMILVIFTYPPTRASDVHRFPNSDQALEAYQAADAYARYAREQKYVSIYADRWWEIEREARWTAEVWQELITVQVRIDQWHDERSAVHHLQELRNYLGEAAYAAGDMPEPSSCWRHLRW